MGVCSCLRFGTHGPVRRVETLATTHPEALLAAIALNERDSVDGMHHHPDSAAPKPIRATANYTRAQAATLQQLVAAHADDLEVARLFVVQHPEKLAELNKLGIVAPLQLVAAMADLMRTPGFRLWPLEDLDELRGLALREDLTVDDVTEVFCSHHPERTPDAVRLRVRKYRRQGILS